MKFILTDIEGTTTSISFVHDELFPYSQKRLLSFLEQNHENDEIEDCLNQVKKTVLEENGLSINNEESGLKLLDWIKSDRKHPALKNLQGLIWETGYSSGEIKGHIYDDVLPNLEKWKKAGITLAVYSSGSIKAQYLIFQYSIKGNLRPYFSHHFDTGVGNKREEKSYENIVKLLNCSPQDVLFLSDIKEELDAARRVGLQTIQLVRKNDVVTGDHRIVATFSEI